MKRFLYSLCLSISLFEMGCHHNAPEKEAEAKFVVTSPMKTDTVVYKDYVCQIHAINHIELRSQERGYLQNIYVDEGQFVHKGQLMFQIMPLLYQAELQKSQSEANYAQIEYETTKNLADSNIVSKSELALSKAKLDKERADVELAKAHLAFTEIRAPFDGIMDRFLKRVGSLVDEGELLTNLSDNSKMWVYFNVPEAEYLDYAQKAKAKNPQTVKLQMANGEIFDHPGVIETVEADFNNETGNIAFRGTFPNPNGLLRHGETGNILMPIELKDALIIPQKSTFEILDKKYVYVVDDKHVLHATQITIGTELPHIYVVTSGITVNDKILMEGLGKVKDGDKIESEFEPFEKVMTDIKNLHAE
ncbi:MAG: efflux RND transporter periplasmic adaptor subunit [Chitinophagales bacterium]